MDQKSEKKDSRLIPILREGVAVVQMIFFKELKNIVSKNQPDLGIASQAMLTGAITNELFGSNNPEEKFQNFRKQHRGIIEQELLNLPTRLPHLIAPLSDALRVQTLCDNQEGIDSTHVLKQANSCNILSADREIPLPSAFMDTVRKLGGDYNLIIPPIEFDKAEEQDLLQ